mgnify:CR=1 FL=1
MEKLLWLYRLPYDAQYPVICLDERPCFLLGDVVKSLSMKEDSAEKQHYEYEKKGSCCLLLAVEPITGKRIAAVYDQRRKIEYAQFMKKVAEEFPGAIKIRVIQDNLNTHNESSFYEYFEAKEAFELGQRFEFYYTPKKASWLNAVETEFSVISRCCLKKRIDDKEILEQKVLDFLKVRQEKKIKINWAFSISDARDKFRKYYEKINKANQKIKET